MLRTGIKAMTYLVQKKVEGLQVDESSVPGLDFLQDLVLLQQLLQRVALLVQNIIHWTIKEREYRCDILLGKISDTWARKSHLTKLIPPMDQISPCIALN